MVVMFIKYLLMQFRRVSGMEATYPTTWTTSPTTRALSPPTDGRMLNDGMFNDVRRQHFVNQRHAQRATGRRSRSCLPLISSDFLSYSLLHHPSPSVLLRPHPSSSVLLRLPPSLNGDNTNAPSLNTANSKTSSLRARVAPESRSLILVLLFYVFTSYASLLFRSLSLLFRSFF